MFDVFAGRRRPAIYRPHHHLVYELNPGYVSRDGRTHHNMLGFRGGEIVLPKPAGLLRIVCMGESTTYCTGIARDEDTYPARLEHHLRESLPAVPLEVVNAGVGGYTTSENLLSYIYKVHPLEPDLVIYYFTHNDVHPRRFPAMSRDYREYTRSWYEPIQFDSTLARLRYLFDRIFRAHTFSIGDHTRRYREFPDRPAENVFRNPPVAFEQNLRFLVTLVKAGGARFLFVNPPYVELDRPEIRREDVHPGVWAVHEHRQIAERLGRELGAGVVDMLGAMPYEGGGTPWRGPLHLDKVHVNEKGADVQGQLIARQLIERGLVPAARDTLPGPGGVV